MADEYSSPSQAASQVGVSVHTIRRWCRDHSDHLSESAQPEKGSSRRLTKTDVQVLTEVARLRNEDGLTTDAINERLNGVGFGETTAIETAQAAPVAPGGAIVPAVVVRSLQAIETRLVALESQRQRLDMAYLIVIAFALGLLVGLSIWWFK
jgi:DNA-binding transcriptional MerR regulator